MTEKQDAKFRGVDPSKTERKDAVFRGIPAGSSSQAQTPKK